MVDHLLPYLQIFRTPKIGPKTFNRLMQQFGNDHELIIKFLKNNAYDIPSLSVVQKEVDHLFKLKGRLLYKDDNFYPHLLKNIDDAPPFLMMLGNPAVFEKRAVSIVGARNASLTGVRFVEKLASALSENGYAVVSGLARGIDTAAHKGSVEKGTVAVLAGGADQIYPLENKKLYAQIQEKGVILSEMPLQTVPSAQLFARRNRIISGLSDVLVLSEVAVHSGSMITANFAIAQGRDVFVVPGHPSDPRSEGGNKLIQQGANLLQNEHDILEALKSGEKHAIKVKVEKIETAISLKKNEKTILSDGTLEGQLLNLLSSTPISIEDVLNHFYEEDAAFLIALISDLDIKGKLVLTENQTLIQK